MKRAPLASVVIGLVGAACAGTKPAPSVAPAPESAAHPAAAKSTPPIADRVDAALRDAAEAGTCWHRTDAVVALGAEAVPSLASLLRDDKQPPETRALVAQSLGRIGGDDAARALRAVAADAAVAEPVRTAAENGLYLAGDKAPVERRIESMRARHADIAVARAGVEVKVAQTRYDVGEFRAAADLWAALVRRESDVDRAGRMAYDWACSAALAGAKDEAFEALAVAVKSDRTDLDWMTRDGDLASLRGDARFDRLVADARASRGASAAAATRPSLKGQPGYEEYQELHHAYWDVAFEGWAAAQNEYWADFDSWLAAEKKTRSDSSAAEYRRAHGPEPVNQAREWIPRFRALLARHREDAVGAEIRNNLLTIFSNERMRDEWVALYLEAMRAPNQETVVGENARAARWMAGSDERRSEILSRLRAWLEEHPSGEPAAQVRLRLAEDLRGRDAVAAHAAYEEIVRLHAGTNEAKVATGALYEMDHLAVGMTLPAFEAKDLRGAAVASKDFAGRVLVLDFWATWCGPCIGEIPNVIALAKKFAGPDFALVGVSLDEDGLALADFLDEHGMTWPQICDLRGFDGDLPRAFNVRGIPDTLLVGKDGRIVARGLRGDQLAAAVEKAIGAPAK
jgi:thiol-disulfide isomerase/thioredoxin